MNTLVSQFTPPHRRHAAFGMTFVLTSGMGALAVKGVQAIERSFGIPWVYPSLGGGSLLLVAAIGVSIIRMGSEGRARHRFAH